MITIQVTSYNIDQIEKDILCILVREGNEKGTTAKEIAKKMGRSVSHVNAKCRKLNLEIKEPVTQAQKKLLSLQEAYARDKAVQDRKAEEAAIKLKEVEDKIKAFKK